ncbi:HKD family nuclease [Epilithonimonas hungarica]|uniref:phospholipase D family protein n=1 Tax=Epilithonimonas hungarica TaxID=454006 RepID=UPI0027816E3C|nr:phospholipase D family protein [Epilithonimonas hungarica]MDP9955045.1 HKD family nuclease [Epilithonimonas hungarica]
MSDINYKILTNDGSKCFEEILISLSEKADSIKLATAFFSDTKLINQWNRDNKKINLLVSLRPPTNYYSLNSIYNKEKVSVQFLGKDFHSKFFIFYIENQPFACIMGSSNFTAGGIYNNIETNVLLDDQKYLKEVDREFSKLWDNSHKLQPSDLEAYKIIFDQFQRKAEKEKEQYEEFERKLLSGRSTKSRKVRICRQAKEHYRFWIAVNEIRDIVSEVSKEEYPDIPVYLVIDHFWHWVKVIWTGNRIQLIMGSNKALKIKKLFKEYCDWDKSDRSYTQEMAENSETIFSFLLSENRIENLTEDDAQKIFSNLHSGAMRTKRFDAAKKFATKNSIEQIRTSFKYLLYSNEELELRIHNLYANPEYKLTEFSLSGIQELIGWVMPEKYPIRNEKANDAVEILGYNFR